jgi:hypothetical protein
MKDESRRLHRNYSYDDPSLIAYWKLTEPFPNNAPEYTIRDYSLN